MKNGNMPAAPIANDSGYPSVARVVLGNNEDQCSGLTKREHFAAMAIQGMIACEYGAKVSATQWARDAVEVADALLAELEKQNDQA